MVMRHTRASTQSTQSTPLRKCTPMGSVRHEHEDCLALAVLVLRINQCNNYPFTVSSAVCPVVKVSMSLEVCYSVMKQGLVHILTGDGYAQPAVRRRDQNKCCVSPDSLKGHSLPGSQVNISGGGDPLLCAGSLMAVWELVGWCLSSCSVSGALWLPTPPLLFFMTWDSGAGQVYTDNAFYVCV
ncbi:hypothetical protein E2C01_061728 [Portunus trituberculatus]|uniref:Uncharacterized protein n=1 Tax=Portunus trituberculatus TaxID=210409 RepID=A0A5B7H4M4_PORTR|nr:hypothetical protein [Portunus trituberculatus]